MASTVCVLAQDGETWVSVAKGKEKKKKSRWSWNISLTFRHCKLCWWSRFLRLAADSVHVCVLCGSIFAYGQSHTEGLPWKGMQSWVWGVMTVTPMNNASLPLSHPSYSQAGPFARRVPGPSQPSFPHGKYLTLTVAHVCHISCRFRRKKKSIVCMMNDGFM